MADEKKWCRGPKNVVPCGENDVAPVRIMQKCTRRKMTETETQTIGKRRNQSEMHGSPKMKTDLVNAARQEPGSTDNAECGPKKEENGKMVNATA